MDRTIGAVAKPPEVRRTATPLDLIPSAAVLIDRALRIVRTNRAAEALLAEGDGLVAMRKDGGLQLAAAAGAETRRLRAVLASAVSGPETDDGEFLGALRIPCVSDHRTLVVIATPLPSAAFPLCAAVGHEARALVQIVDPCASVARQASILQRAVGLTPAEGRVLALVAEGLPTPKVAEALDLSPNTVRTHLARCFDKTGVRSQAGLVRLVASIAAQSA